MTAQDYADARIAYYVAHPELHEELEMDEISMQFAINQLKIHAFQWGCPLFKEGDTGFLEWLDSFPLVAGHRPFLALQS